MKYEKIPTVSFPTIQHYSIVDIDEKLVSLSENGFVCNSKYYEQKIKGSLKDCYIRNRRILYNVMIKAGFTNLPSEWWHYDYGTKFWAYFTGKDALYKGILNNNFLI